MLQGRERHESFTYPDDEYMYYVLAEKFGWTPIQADEQPAYLVDWLMAIAATVDELKAENANPKSQSR